MTLIVAEEEEREKKKKSEKRRKTNFISKAINSTKNSATLIVSK